MDYYSPKAYGYIRKKFNNNLPNVSTLRKWYSNSDANGEAGISRESISMIRNLVAEANENNKPFLCSLSFDEMSIHRNVQYCAQEKKISGFITYGNLDAGEDELPVARYAIVFMVTDVSSQKSFPVAHHFIKSLNARQKADLIRNILEAITQAGATTINITCDGLVTNFSTLELLGAHLKIDNLQPSIRNPFNNTKINIFFDACHMLKLTRNCIESCKLITDDKDRPIEWRHFESLERFRGKNGFVTHKINSTHIDIARNKMKVSLAAQLLSRSAANSMAYLMESGEPCFEDCSGTIDFTLKMNNLFDILNTGHKDTLNNNNNNLFKAPLSVESALNILPYLDECLGYLKGLKLNGIQITKSLKKTGFLGFIINIFSLKSIYDEYLTTGKLERIPTFILSQDMLESFFGRLRAKGGFNDNPTVEQFKSAYRKTLINDQLSSSSRANCDDQLSIYHSKSSKKCRQEDRIPDNGVAQYDSLESFCSNDYLLDACQDATICGIASRIEHTIRTKGIFHCRLCLNIFNENGKIENTHGDHSKIPCISTVYICQVAYKYLNIFKAHLKFEYDLLVEKILDEIDYNNTYSNSDFSQHEIHKNYFVDCMVGEFLRVQLTEIAKAITLKERGLLMRHKLKKIIHFSGQ